MHQEATEEAERVRFQEIELTTLRAGYEALRQRALHLEKERDELRELVTFYEAELRRERGFV